MTEFLNSLIAISIQRLALLHVNVLYLIIIACFFLSARSYSSTPSAKASAIITLGDSPNSSTISIAFDRTTSDRSSLLMTSLNLSYKGVPKKGGQLKVDPLNNYFSLLTGWFVIQQEGQELWVGINLPEGENHGELTLSIPGIISETDERSNIYELKYYQPNTILAHLATSATSAQHAPMHSIKISQPKWGSVIKAKTTGWSQNQGGYYIPDQTGKKANLLVIKRTQTLIADWLKNALSSFAGGLAVASIGAFVLFGMRSNINNKHRQFSLAVVSISLIILLCLSGEFPPNPRTLFFDGANIMGFIIPFFLVMILPARTTEVLRLYLLGILNPNS